MVQWKNDNFGQRISCLIHLLCETVIHCPSIFVRILILVNSFNLYMRGKVLFIYCISTNYYCEPFYKSDIQGPNGNIQNNCALQESRQFLTENLIKNPSGKVFWWISDENIRQNQILQKKIRWILTDIFPTKYWWLFPWEVFVGISLERNSDNFVVVAPRKHFI